MTYYNESRQFHLQALDLEPVVKAREHGFSDRGPTGLRNFREAGDYYTMVLENCGRICEEFIAPRAQAVDEKGATFANGEISWAPETRENMDVLIKAGLSAAGLPRQYGGLNLPQSVCNILVEMISQADASLMNLIGLQEIAQTILRFGSDEQKQRILPRFANGTVTGSMALTEPDAGSDLQAVSLKAIEKDGRWYLDGVKRFITNGSAEISLVLARSEANTRDGRGLSMFVYERDSHLVVRRIEDKLGIHGSPTAEIQFNMAPAELVGKRRYGLIEYVMSLMDGARLGVSFQALGIAQAALEEANKYANEREQFGKKIVHIPAVYQMLINMKIDVETTRALLNHTSLMVDHADIINERLANGEPVKAEARQQKALCALLTPLAKFTSTEMANRVAYDALQIHGGVGYMKDFPVERLYRDARITNIYEGTTQLQVVATLGGITSGLAGAQIEKLTSVPLQELTALRHPVTELAARMQQATECAKTQGSKEFLDYAGCLLVEMASLAYRAALYLPLADRDPNRAMLFRHFLSEADTRTASLLQRVKNLARDFDTVVVPLAKEFCS